MTSVLVTSVLVTSGLSIRVRPWGQPAVPVERFSLGDHRVIGTLIHELVELAGAVHTDFEQPALMRPFRGDGCQIVKQRLVCFGDLAGGGLALVDVKDGKIVVHGKGTPQRALPGKRTALPAPEEQ